VTVFFWAVASERAFLRSRLRERPRLSPGFPRSDARRMRAFWTYFIKPYILDYMRP
jgi:hypothetical protein